MASKDQKILKVLKAEIDGVPERYKGYREDLGILLEELLKSEHAHSISRTSIVKIIGGLVNRAGKNLHEKQTGTKQD